MHEPVATAAKTTASPALLHLVLVLLLVLLLMVLLLLVLLLLLLLADTLARVHEPAATRTGAVPAALPPSQ